MKSIHTWRSNKWHHWLTQRIENSLSWFCAIKEERNAKNLKAISPSNCHWTDEDGAISPSDQPIWMLTNLMTRLRHVHMAVTDLKPVYSPCLCSILTLKQKCWPTKNGQLPPAAHNLRVGARGRRKKKNKKTTQGAPQLWHLYLASS